MEEGTRGGVDHSDSPGRQQELIRREANVPIAGGSIVFGLRTWFCLVDDNLPGTIV